MSTTETRTETRTHVEVSTEEVEFYECPGCGQFVEDAELMPVLVNVEPEQADTLRGAVLENHAQVCCRYCAASMWDFDPEETGRTDAILRRGERVGAAGRALLSVVTPSAQTLGMLISLTITVLLAVTLFDTVMGTFDSAAFEQATRDVATTEPTPAFGAPLPVVGLVPVFVMGVVIMVFTPLRRM